MLASSWGCGLRRQLWTFCVGGLLWALVEGTLLWRGDPMKHSRTCVGWVYRCGVSQTAGVAGPVRASLSSRTACPLGRQPAADGCAPRCWPGRGFARAPCGFVRIRLWLLVPLFEVEPQLPVPGTWFQVQPRPSGGPCGPHCGYSDGRPGQPVGQRQAHPLALSPGRTRPRGQGSAAVPTGRLLCSGTCRDTLSLFLPETEVLLVTDWAAPDERGRVSLRAEAGRGCSGLGLLCASLEFYF